MIRSRRFLIIVATTSALLLAGCAAGTPEPSALETQKQLSQEELVLQNLANRPVIGSPEYFERVVVPLRVPYVEGQPAVDVVLALETAFNDTFVSMGYEDAPQSKDDVVDWAFDTGQSVDELVTLLDLSYFDTGAQQAWFGGTDTAYGQQTFENLQYFETHRTRMTRALQGVSPAHFEVVTFDPGIASESPTEIRGLTETYWSGDVVTPSISTTHYRLVATDDDGDGAFDYWKWVGSDQ